MADDLEKRGLQDRSRINVEHEHEISYWAKKVGCSENEPRLIMRRVGNSVEAVRHEWGQTSLGTAR